MSTPTFRPQAKIAGIMLIVAAITFGIYKFSGSKQSTSSTESKGILSFLSSDDDFITVGTNTYAGFLPFMYLNNGLEPTEDSYIYKNYGIKLKIVIQDDFNAGRSAFTNGDIDIIYGTLDSWPIETGDNSAMSDARFFNVSNFSRGTDAIVVNKNINTVSDLIGKVVTCSEGTASHTLLLNTLETSGIGSDKINTTDNVMPDKVNLRIVGSGLDAAASFKANSCNAAVVFSPDDQDLVKSIPGTKVLVSTKQASNIICDGLIAKASYLEKNKETIIKLISALSDANVKMNTDPNAVKQAAKAFAKSYGTDEEFAIEGSKNIYYMTIADQANFFGFNSGYNGIKADELYSKMCNTYSRLNLTKNPKSWRKVSDLSIVEYLIENVQEVKGDQTAEKPKSFTPITKEVETKASFSNKKITIEFPVNGYTLSNDARSIIDMEFASIAKQFSGARIRIEGNTDNTGNYENNVKLSHLRAQAVADYIISTYNFDKNRIIVIGNGPKNAISDNIQGSNQRYRTTDFQLISE